MSDIGARLILHAYRMFGSLAYPFMGPFLMVRARKGKEDRSRRHERYGYPNARPPEGPMVWFHAASVGESMAVIPLIEYIHSQGINTIMTTGTVTSAEIVRERLPAQTYHQYVPMDMRPAVRRFLGHWKPDLAIFTESEVWPVTIMEMKARRIPQVLVNARMSDRSYKRWQGAPKVAEVLFGSFSHVVAQSKLDAERFLALGARPVAVSGNLKVDAATLPYNQADFDRLQGEIGSRKVWIAASTHTGEDEIAITVHKKLKGYYPDLLTLIVPRHPERVKDVKKLIDDSGLAYVLRSSGEQVTPDTDIILGDTIGEMGLYLRLAQVCFVGKSLGSEGGQNPLEPAVTGTAIVSGRNVGNFRDAYRNLLKNGGARLVSDVDMLTSNVGYLLGNDAKRNEMIEKAAATVTQMSGALDKTIETLDAHVFPLKVKRNLDGYAGQG